MGPFKYLLLAALLLPVQVVAQQFPVKPVRWLVAFPPGGPQDIRSRAVAIELANALKGTVIIENKAGAGGNLAMMDVARSAPDGYTVGLGYVATHAMNPHLSPDIKFDPVNDHAFVAPMTTYTLILIIDPALPIRSVTELINFAKANPTKVSYGTGGIGTTAHLSSEAFRAVTGAPMLHVPFQGAAPVVTALMAGQITYTFNSMSTSLAPMRSGKVRALAVTSTKRSSFTPDIPTMQEAGVQGYSDLVSDQWTALFAPAALPKPIAARLYSAMGVAMKAPSVTEKLAALAEEPWNMTPEQWPAFLRSELAKWGKIIKIANVKAE